MVEDNEELMSLEDENICTCSFYRRYQLPCRHIWANHLLYSCLKKEDYKRWAYMWEESGYEIYETMESIYIERGINDEIGAPERHRLEVRETLESIKARYYGIEGQARELHPDVGDQLIRWWLNKLTTVSGEVWKAGIEEFERESGVKVERTHIERLAKPKMDINGGFIDSNVVVSSACQPGSDEDE